MLRVLEFVDEGDRVIRKGNTAVALCVSDKVVFAEAEFARALIFARQIDLVRGFSKRECRLSILMLPSWIGTWRDWVVDSSRLA